MDRTIVAFRYFRERGGELYSLTPAPRGLERWPAAGVVNAACERPASGQVSHLAPAAGCTCGVYAVDSLATLRRAGALSRFVVWHLRGDIVVAAVQVWSAPGRPVMVGELRGAPGYQYRAPHMRVLALAEGRAARRAADRHGLLVLPLAGLEPFAREHGAQLRPGQAEHQRATPVARPAGERAGRGGGDSAGIGGLGRRLIEAMGHRLRPGWPRAWTAGIAVVLTLAAAAHLTVVVAWLALVLSLSLLAWLLRRALYVAVVLLTHPVEAVFLSVVGSVLLITAWSRAADLLRSVLA